MFTCKNTRVGISVFSCPARIAQYYFLSGESYSLRRGTSHGHMTSVTGKSNSVPETRSQGPRPVELRKVKKFNAGNFLIYLYIITTGRIQQQTKCRGNC